MGRIDSKATTNMVPGSSVTPPGTSKILETSNQKFMDITPIFVIDILEAPRQ